jgi:dihydroorotase
VQTIFNMAKLLRSLRFIDEKSVHPPRDYIYTGSEILEIPDDFKGVVDEIIDCSGMMASRGWIDLRCLSGEPGEEYKESLESLGELLKYSGFTKAVLLPNTHPAIQTKNEIQFLKSGIENWATDLIVNAAVTKDCKGDDFTDILDLHHQGVKIFGDGLNPLSNPDRLMKVLQYLQKFDGILFDHSFEPLLALYGQMHEGEVSTRIGMKGIPNIAEDIAVQKNVELLRYAGGRMHFQTVSTTAAIESIRKAKKEGLQVTADISLYQLLFLDEDLSSFDPNFKVLPPFRGKEERAALIAALKDGTIDAIVSNHQPQDFDAKHMEFDLAQPGMIGLQAFLPGLVKLSEELGWPLLIEKITSGPSKVLGEEEEKFSSLTVFDPSASWHYDKKSNLSQSANHPWFGSELKGAVKYLINGNQFVKI